MTSAPPYFEDIRANAARRWVQLEQDPELAGPWHQLFKQVQSPRHVVSELLQNADDAGATEAAVDIQDGQFVFTHNGEDFTEEHLTSLCRFGYSNKRALHTIGFRGIGFKSTFSLGDQVRLSTPTLSVAFHRERFTEPVWCDVADTPDHTAIQVAIKDDHRQRELEKNLADWVQSPASLLFFHHIRSLRVGEKEVRWISQGTGPIADSEWMSLSSNPGKKYLLIRSPAEDFPKDALDEIRQERMISVAEESTFPPCRVEIVLGLEGRLFVVLPTGVAPDLPFACNAPFIQDPARVKIKDPETSPTNQWLLKRAGELAAKALLAWVSDADQTAAQRSEAYGLLPNVDRQNNSLEGSCAANIRQAMDDMIGDSRFLLTETGGLVSRTNCQVVPEVLLNIWSHDLVVAFFAGGKQAILARAVSANDRRKLVNWGCVTAVTNSNVIEVLKAKPLPCPESWRQLMMLWAYLSDQVKVHWPYKGHTDMNIVPVQGRDVLYAAADVVRLGDTKLLQSDEDWTFLSEHLFVLNPDWPQFLADQRRKAEEDTDKIYGQKIESTTDLLRKLNLTQASNVSEVIQRFANNFFDQKEYNIIDCVRLARLAAALDATVSDFRFVTRDGHLRSVKDCLVMDVHNDLDTYVDEDWYREHILHEDYSVLLSCTEEEWRQWLASGRSKLFTFVPLLQARKSIWNRNELREILTARGFNDEPYYRYVTHDFIIEDWDFEDGHWKRWQALASADGTFWGRLLARILEQPTFFWTKASNARVLQKATTGSTKEIIPNDVLPSSWIVSFRNLPCLQDTRGIYRHPAELLRRTPDTESLLDVEPFVRAEFDTEATRSLLNMLGVRSTPTGPDRLLDRVRSLATVDNPPVYEVEKWYHRLDQLMNKCSTEEVEEIKRAFTEEKIILTESNGWSNAAGTFLQADEGDVPGAALVHPTVRDLTLWHKVGVAERPTADLAIDWLANLKSGVSLSTDELRRVRALLPRYPERIWNETGHWLNIEGEWTPIENLVFSLTMQALVAWKHLFTPIKQKIADFQKLTADLCAQHPFSSLRPLAQSVEDKFDDNLFGLPDPQTKLWLTELGVGLRRIILDDDSETCRVRELASRLAVTEWQVASGLQTVPYIDDTPAGTPRQIDVLWKNSRLYVENRSIAKMAKAVAQELVRVFNIQEIADAIKLCYDRSPEFVLEYIEENFRLLPKEEVVPLTDAEPQAGASVTQEESLDDKRTIPFDTTVPDDHQTTASGYDTIEGLENANAGEVEEENRPLERRKYKPAKPSLMERFAQDLGYAQDGSNRFCASDGGWIEKVSGAQAFPWERYSANGELLQCYWVDDHCIIRDSVQIEAEVWKLCTNHPAKYSLILAAPDGSPDEYSGERICALHDSGQMRLFPASYRLAYEEGAKPDSSADENVII